MEDTTLAPRDNVAAVRQLVQQMAGRRLPGERDLAAQLEISRPRLRGILAGLRAEGLIEQRPGSGTYAVAAQGNLRRVALIIDGRLKLGDDPFFSHLVECLHHAVQVIGARCVVERAAVEMQHLPTLEDGALTLGLAGQTVIERLRPGDPPVVGLLLPPSSRPARRASVLTLDDREAGREAAQALMKDGCRTLLFVGRRDIPASRERLAGAEAAAQEKSVSVQFIDCHLNYAAGLALGCTLTLPEGPAGIIATNDWLAVGLHAGLQRQDWARRRSIPLVSFDGLSLASDPALCIRSLAVPLETIAEDAVAELARLTRSPAALGRSVCYALHWNS